MNNTKKNKQKIIWTLTSSVPESFVSNFDPINSEILHIPLISLKLNEKFKNIDSKISNYKKIIVTSPFAAMKLVKHLNASHEIYTVGEKVCRILYESNLRIVKSFFNSKQLAEYLRSRDDMKILHLCSEKSDKSVWPRNVDSFSFYKPEKNKDIRKYDIPNLKNSTIIFGSPSGVETWFKYNRQNGLNTYACMGHTTAKALKSFTKNNIIFPQDSRTNTLITLISEHYSN